MGQSALHLAGSHLGGTTRLPSGTSPSGGLASPHHPSVLLQEKAKGLEGNCRGWVAVRSQGRLCWYFTCRTQEGCRYFARAKRRSPLNIFSSENYQLFRTPGQLQERLDSIKAILRKPLCHFQRPFNCEVWGWTGGGGFVCMPLLWAQSEVKCQLSSFRQPQPHLGML